MKSIGIMRILQKMFQNYLPSKQFNKYISFNICYNKSTISFPNHNFTMNKPQAQKISKNEKTIINVKTINDFNARYQRSIDFVYYVD